MRCPAARSRTRAEDRILTTAPTGEDDRGPQDPGSAGPLILHGIDHIGLALRDIEAEVAAWRGLGFIVSDPAQLFSTVQGEMRPLGQISAHVVFANAYVELSAPVPGAGNHLEPFLAAAGEGVRILVHATDDIRAAHRAIGDAPEPRLSARRVILPGGAQEARFLWFPLPVPSLPDALCAVVEHLTPGIVFHPSLWAHPNGFRSVQHLVARGQGALHPPAGLPPASLGVAVRHAQDPGQGALRISDMVLRKAGGEAGADNNLLATFGVAR